MYMYLDIYIYVYIYMYTHQYTLAQPTSRRRELGYATLQPTPDPYHKHFSERFSRLPQAKKTVTLWYTTKVFPLW